MSILKFFKKKKVPLPVPGKEEDKATDGIEEPVKRRQIAMSRFTIEFESLNGDQNKYTWLDYPTGYQVPDSRPYNSAGINYKDDGKSFFIPWHQIKKSSLRENVLWDDGITR